MCSALLKPDDIHYPGTEYPPRASVLPLIWSEGSAIGEPCMQAEDGAIILYLALSHPYPDAAQLLSTFSHRSTLFLFYTSASVHFCNPLISPSHTRIFFFVVVVFLPFVRRNFLSRPSRACHWPDAN